nr:unnamed protein product [Callosobruchus analis]
MRQRRFAPHIADRIHSSPDRWLYWHAIEYGRKLSVNGTCAVSVAPASGCETIHQELQLAKDFMCHHTGAIRCSSRRQCSSKKTVTFVFITCTRTQQQDSL